MAYKCKEQVKKTFHRLLLLTVTSTGHVVTGRAVQTSQLRSLICCEHLKKAGQQGDPSELLHCEQTGRLNWASCHSVNVGYYITLTDHETIFRQQNVMNPDSSNTFWFLRVKIVACTNLETNVMTP